MKKENMKTVLFGYDRKTVDIFLKKLHRLHEEELGELRRKLGKTREKREYLMANLTQLEEKRKEVLPEELMEAALSRVNETHQESGMSVANGSSEIESGNASRKAINFYDAAARRARKVVSLKEKSSRTSDLFGEAAEETKSEKKEAAFEQTTEGDYEDEVRSEVLESVETISVETTPVEASDQVSVPVIATEGEVLNETPEKAAEESAPIEVAVDANVAIDETIAVKPVGEHRSVSRIKAHRVVAEGLGFWDDAEIFLEPEGEELLITVYESAAAVEVPSSLAEPRVPKPPAIESSQEKSPASVAVEAPMTTEHSASPELDALKRSYIVGKLAGEDLLDRRGHVLVAQNTVITEEAIWRAEKEGKLVELIVNMIIPGLED